MLLPQKLARLAHLMLAALLLQTAGGALNGSQVTSAEWLVGRDMVAKEGSSVLIECNVTADHDGVRWYNSKGAELSEDPGGREDT